MSKTRQELSDYLHSLVDHVYFQPPESYKIEYPCIIYKLSNFEDVFADNLRYRTLKRYELTVISKDPEFDAVDKLREQQYCSFDRFYVVENLNHFVFTLFY